MNQYNNTNMKLNNIRTQSFVLNHISINIQNKGIDMIITTMKKHKHNEILHEYDTRPI